jgi:tetratricopeptide (TPR) repeat protein
MAGCAWSAQPEGMEETMMKMRINPVACCVLALMLAVLAGNAFGQDRIVESERLASQLVDSYNKALQRYGAKDYPGALGIIERELLAVTKTYYLAYYLKAMLDASLADKPEAERSQLLVKDVDDYFYWKQSSGWKKYLRIDPARDTKEEATLYNLRAMAKRTLGEYKGAIEDSTRSILLATRVSDPLLLSAGYHHRGVSKQYLGDLGGAEKDHLEALRIDPSYWWPHQSLLFIYSDRRNADQCFEMLFRMVELDPDRVYDLLLDEELSWLDADSRMEQIMELIEITY